MACGAVWISSGDVAYDYFGVSVSCECVQIRRKALRSDRGLWLMWLGGALLGASVAANILTHFHSVVCK